MCSPLPVMLDRCTYCQIQFCLNLEESVNISPTTIDDMVTTSFSMKNYAKQISTVESQEPIIG